MVKYHLVFFSVFLSKLKFYDERYSCIFFHVDMKKIKDADTHSLSLTVKSTISRRKGRVPDRRLAEAVSDGAASSKAAGSNAPTAPQHNLEPPRLEVDYHLLH